MNIALLLWLLCVGAFGGMLVLLLLGLLDRAFSAPAARAHWVEVNNQVVAAGDDDTCEQCNVVRVEKKIEAIDVVEEDESSLLASNGEMVDHGLSGGRWRVEKVRRMISVVTMLSLLVLLYTRGFIL
ncbi:unnamed protein product [Triticum turgidum subsp. durum]|uniref:Transmembrane protein n=1 Tax=Triticum turgidum subsp. durum TaxID=4567 RepID=A0A9R0X5E1_TRITD|nr:unnamed protein product [Triticum turgidum subsp. durum]